MAVLKPATHHFPRPFSYQYDQESPEAPLDHDDGDDDDDDKEEEESDDDDRDYYYKGIMARIEELEMALADAHRKEEKEATEMVEDDNK